MSEPIDQDAAHRYFATEFFNRTWDLLELDSRSDEDIEMMIDIAHASRTHWRQRDDVSPKHESISAWQLSRVYSVADRPDEALRHGVRALEIATRAETGALYVGYGHEAVARAAAALGDSDTAVLHLEAGRDLLSSISGPDERQTLKSDLDAIVPDAFS